jgi:hypothetical protein
MYKEIEILRTDFENKYLIRLNDKTMRVGFMVKDIIEFLKEGRSRDEMQDYFKNQYELFVGKDVIDDVIENKINPFVIKHEDTSFSKILTLFNPSVIPIPEMILKVFNKHFFYFMGFIFFLTYLFFDQCLFLCWLDTVPHGLNFKDLDRVWCAAFYFIDTRIRT